MKTRRTLALLTMAAALSGCSTGAWFKLPENSTLTLAERPAQYSQGLVKSRPFSWGNSAGIRYRIQDRGANTINEGKLKSRFRVASIFWPPVAIAYWPMGFAQRCYDLTGETPQTCTYQDFHDLRSAQRLRR